MKESSFRIKTHQCPTDFIVFFIFVNVCDLKNSWLADGPCWRLFARIYSSVL